MELSIPHGWAGVGVGKGHHWVCLIDEAGTTVWSSKVVNDEGALLEAIRGVLSRADQVSWGVDVTGTMSGLLLALLAAHGQQVKYAPGRTVNQMATAYRGEAIGPGSRATPIDLLGARAGPRRRRAVV